MNELWNAVAPTTPAQLRAEVQRLDRAVSQLAGEMAELRSMVDNERRTSKRLTLTPEERQVHKREYMREYMRDRRAQRV